MALAITKLTHLCIPLKDIREATNNFHKDNIISRGGFGPAYKGRLLWSGEWIKIAARRLDRRYGLGDLEFWTEVSLLADLKHPNIVSMIGYCDEEGEKIIITKHEANGSLEQFLNSPSLTWTQRLRICIGVARALSYLHSDDGRDYGVIHRNINSYTILLDENWEPKLSGFEISIKESVNRMDQVNLSEAIVIEGYMDPAIEKTLGVTYKSDIYSFGVVLFEILCGRLAFIQNDSNRYLAPLARYHYENKTLQDVIHPDLWNQMSPWSLVKYSKSAYSCLDGEQAYRPDIGSIVYELDYALELQLPFENLGKRLGHLKIPLSDVQLATENFSEIYNIGLTRYYALYRAELYHFDKEFPSSVSGKIMDKVPQRHNTVIIKRILPKDDEVGEEVFYTEIEMLTSVQHPNIVTLLGFCVEGSEMILIIDNLSNGYLGDTLRDVNNKRILTWEKRLKICINVAQALNYIHFEMKDQKMIINRDIKSDNIALDENWQAKIVDFAESVYLPLNHDDEALHYEVFFGTDWYIDPEYERNGKLKRKSDVYSFGVVLLEVLFGRLANDPIYLKENEKGLAFVARQRFRMGTLMDMIDPIIMDETGEKNFIPNKRPNKDSIRTFIEVAYKCVVTTQDKRPTMKAVLKQLEKALFLQGKNLHLKIPFINIQLATRNFSKAYNIWSNEHYALYRAELHHFDKEFSSSTDGTNENKVLQSHKTVIVKRFLPRDDEVGEEMFYTEIHMLTTVKHPNIVTLLGFCVEGSEKILVIENLSNGYLTDTLEDANNKRILTWEKRLKICIDVAKALNYIHYEMEDQKTIINRDIRSRNIAMDENWVAKIANFEVSVFLPRNQNDEALHHGWIAGIPRYMDPVYEKTGKLKRESDVYGFGVVLFEILFGRMAYDPIYLKESDKGLAFVARRCFNMGTLEDMIDPLIKDETGENSFILNRGPNKDSVRRFIEIAYKCVAETQDQRPTMKVVLKQLEKALLLQTNNTDNPFISLEDIKLATQNFHVDNCIGGGGFGKVYIGKLQDGDVYKTIVAKRLDTRLGQGEQQFLGEVQILLEYKHANIISLVGYCDENGEKIIVYEYASRRSLDRYLNDVRLTWIKRLNICIEVASALDFLHGGAGKQAKVVHRDLKTANILLSHDWKAKLADFGLSLISPLARETDYIINRPCGTRGYVDPLYENTKFLTIKSDIYSFGVVLFEILCGRSTFTIYEQEGLYLPDFVKNRFEEGKHDEVVFKQIREQVVPKSLNTFQEIAYQCLQHESEKRPTTTQVLMQLKKALEFQGEISRGD